MIRLVFVIPLDIALLIVDLAAIADPAQAALAALLGEGERLESIAEEGVLLDQVDDIELDPLVLLGVGDLEVEPLVVAAGVDIVLQNEVIGLEGVAVVVVGVGVEEVAALEVGVEDETCVVVFGVLVGRPGLDLREVAFGFGL